MGTSGSKDAKAVRLVFDALDEAATALPGRFTVKRDCHPGTVNLSVEDDRGATWLTAQTHDLEFETFRITATSFRGTRWVYAKHKLSDDVSGKTIFTCTKTAEV